MSLSLTVPKLDVAIASKLSDDLLLPMSKLQKSNEDRQTYATIHMKLKNNESLSPEEFKNLQGLHARYAPKDVGSSRSIADGARKDLKDKPKDPKAEDRKETSATQQINVEKKTFTRKDENGKVTLENLDQLRAIPAAKDSFSKYDAKIDKLNQDADNAHKAAEEAKAKLEQSNARKEELGSLNGSFRQFYSDSKATLSQAEVKGAVRMLVSHPKSSLTEEQKQKLNAAAIAKELPEDANLSPEDKEKKLANRAAIAVATLFNEMIHAWDCDNGAEFINRYLVKHFADRKIAFTRSRPYHKNDNAHVEQRNYSHVRQLLGYQRIDNREILTPLQDIMRSYSLLKNLFYPSRKLLNKVVIGSYTKKLFDDPKTPYQRVLEHQAVTNEQKERLRIIYNSINPVVFKKQIFYQLRQLLKRASVTPHFEASTQSFGNNLF